MYSENDYIEKCVKLKVCLYLFVWMGH